LYVPGPHFTTFDVVDFSGLLEDVGIVVVGNDDILDSEVRIDEGFIVEVSIRVEEVDNVVVLVVESVVFGSKVVVGKDVEMSDVSLAVVKVDVNLVNGADSVVTTGNSVSGSFVEVELIVMKNDRTTITRIIHIIINFQY
jgi:hypothetical protein